MSLASGSPEPIPTDIAPHVLDPLSDVEGAVVPYPLDTEQAVASGLLPAGRPRSTFRRGLEVFWENKLAVTGVGIFVFMLLFSVAAYWAFRRRSSRVGSAKNSFPPRDRSVSRIFLRFAPSSRCARARFRPHKSAKPWPRCEPSSNR